MPEGEVSVRRHRGGQHRVEPAGPDIVSQFQKALPESQIGDLADHADAPDEHQGLMEGPAADRLDVGIEDREEDDVDPHEEEVHSDGDGEVRPVDHLVLQVVGEK